jgi:hypothetical protein
LKSGLGYAAAQQVGGQMTMRFVVMALAMLMAVPAVAQPGCQADQPCARLVPAKDGAFGAMPQAAAMTGQADAPPAAAAPASNSSREIALLAGLAVVALVARRRRSVQEVVS